MKTLEQRFLEKVRRTKKCWLWKGSLRPDGYGHFSEKKKSLSLAHRVSYKLFVAPLKPGLTIDHLCNNHGCVNPAHLEQVSIKQNVLRGNGISAQNARKSHCPRGHPYSKSNTYIVKKTGSRKCRKCFNHK